ncbi:MAG: hypothetical protein M0R28_06260 [Pigmentiphaga sp.]|nr:hypothetical protein [Pigmentiphaga sp.]
MQNEQMATAYAPEYPRPAAEAARSAVSWAAIVAGAVAGTALSAALLVGGSGLGFLALSPWSGEGASGTTLAAGSIIWLLVTQVIAYGVAGYIAGRLRTRWTDALGDEIDFRDTAHGFLVWALSVVISIVVAGMAASALVSGAAKTGAALAGSAAGAVTAVSAGAAGAGGEAEESPLAYFTDAVLRPADASRAASPAAVREEVSRLLVRSFAEGELSADDRAYLVRLVAQRTGLSEAEAEQRISEITTQARQTAEEAEQTAREAADVARKAAATLSLWAFISMLLGAFVASYAAMIGGRARDRV